MQLYSFIDMYCNEIIFILVAIGLQSIIIFQMFNVKSLYFITLYNH